MEAVMISATFLGLETRITHGLRDLDVRRAQIAPPLKWSVQQIVEHLSLSYASTEALIAGRIAKGRRTQARPTISQHCARLLVVGLGYFPSGVAAPEAVIPVERATALNGEQIASRYSERLRYMDAVLEEAEAVFGETKPVASHLLLGPLSISQWRRFHVVHGTHHGKQIDRLLQLAKIT